MQILKAMPFQTYLVELLRYLLIPLVIAIVSYFLARRQLNGSNVNLFRQKWMDDLRNSVSLFISKAELISIVDLDDGETYFKHYQELTQMQAKVELLLDAEDEQHKKLVKKMVELREIIHENKIKEKKMQQCLDDVLALTKVALNKEWMIIKRT